MSGCALTASRVANRVGTSTPLSAGRVCVLVMVFSFGWWSMTTMQTLRSAPSPDLPDSRVAAMGRRRSEEGPARLFLGLDTFNDRNRWNQVSAGLGTLLGVWAH